MAYSFLIISSSTFSRPSPLFLLPLLMIFPLLIQTASGDGGLRYNCSSTSSGNYTKNRTYESNLQNLFADLRNNMNSSHGFRNTSYGTHGSPDQVYGLALCRGDVLSSSACQQCVEIATTSITGVCPNSRAAIQWRELCYVKYSDYDFFGEIDTDNKFTLLNSENVTYNYVTKNLTAVTLGLLSNLSMNATETAGIHMFALGQAHEPQEEVDIYGMVQCSGDLSKDNCTKCIDYVMDEIPKYIAEDGQKELFTLGARVKTGSCTIRYEEYDFSFN